MERREFNQFLLAMGIGSVENLKIADLKDTKLVVFEHPGKLGPLAATRIREAWERLCIHNFGGIIPCVVLQEGMTLKTVKDWDG